MSTTAKINAKTIIRNDGKVFRALVRFFENGKYLYSDIGILSRLEKQDALHDAIEIVKDYENQNNTTIRIEE